jgi:hypothetical protein
MFERLNDGASPKYGYEIWQDELLRSMAQKLGCFAFESRSRWDHNFNGNQLGVRKVDLPPLFLPFVQSQVAPRRVSVIDKSNRASLTLRRRLGDALAAWE